VRVSLSRHFLRQYYLAAVLFSSAAFSPSLCLAQSGLAQSAELALSWSAPTRSEDLTKVRDLAGYRVHLGTRSGRYGQVIELGTVTKHTVGNLYFNTIYYLNITAVDVAGNESAMTQEQVVRTVRKPNSSAPPTFVPTADDFDGDGLKDEFELAYGTRIDRADTDRDGVSDLAEILVGSDPVDRGSVLERRFSFGCVRWSSAFPNLWNIFEQTSFSRTPQVVSLLGFESDGSLFHREQLQLGDFGRNDILAHERAVTANSAEGNFCSSAVGALEAFESRMVYYLPETKPEKLRQFQFALSERSTNGQKGPQIVPINMFHPGLGVSDASKVTANWLHLGNESGRREAGTLYIHDSSGALLRSEYLQLNGYEIQSFPLHDFGTSWYGSARWVPERAVTRFSLNVSRYFYDNPWAYPTFDAALQIEGKTATGRTQYVPVDTIGRSVVLEVLNALDRDVVAEVYVGTTATTLNLPPFGSVHLPLDSFVGPAQSARVAIRSDARESIYASAIHYARATDGTLRYAYSMRAIEPLKPRLRGTYNTHLAQSSWLTMTSDVSQFVTVVMRRTNGTKVVELRLPISDLLSIDLSSYEFADRTGTVFVIPDEPGTISAWVLRVRPWEYVIPTEMN